MTHSHATPIQNSLARRGAEQGGAMAPRWALRPWPMIFIACATLALVTGACAMALRVQAEQAWKSKLSDLTALLAGHAKKSLASSHGALDSLSQFATSKSSTAEYFELALASKEAHELLLAQIKKHPMLDVATFVDSHGQVLSFSRQHPAPAINLSDRDYFKAQRDDPMLGDFLSVPVKNKANGKWTHYLSRRLNGPDGRFMGLALVGISSEGFAGLYDEMGKDLGEGAAVALMREDYTLLARWPHRDDLIGRSYPQGSVAHLLLEPSTESSEAFVETPKAHDGLPPTRRLVAARRVGGQPLIVSAVVAESRCLVDWRRTCAFMAAISALCIAGLLMAGSRWARAARIREQSQSLASDTLFFDPREALFEIINGLHPWAPFDLSRSDLKISKDAPNIVRGNAHDTLQILGSVIIAC